VLALAANPCDELMKTIWPGRNLRRGSRVWVNANGNRTLALYKASSCSTDVSIFPVVNAPAQWTSISRGLNCCPRSCVKPSTAGSCVKSDLITITERAVARIFRATPSNRSAFRPTRHAAALVDAIAVTMPPNHGARAGYHRVLFGRHALSPLGDANET